MSRFLRFLVGLFLLPAHLLAQQAAEKPPRYPLETFGTLPYMTNPKLSPSGDYVAAELAVNGQISLAIMGIRGQNEPLRLLPKGENDISWYRWVNDDWIVVSFSHPDRANKDYDVIITRMVAVSRDMKQINRLRWLDVSSNGDNVICWPHDGSTEILMQLSGSYVASDSGAYGDRVEWVDVINGKSRVAQRSFSDIDSWIADSKCVVRMGFAYDYFRDRGKVIYRANANDGYQITERADFAKDERISAPVIFKDGSSNYLSWVRSDDRRALADYDVLSGKVGAIAFSHDRYDVNDAIVSPDGTNLLGVQYIDDRRRTVWLDPQLKQLQAQIDASTGTRRAAFQSMSYTMQTLLFEIGSSRTPDSYFAFDRSDGVLRMIGNNGEATKGKVMAPMTPVSYKARDGVEIPAYLTLPVGRSPKNLPLIMLPHGGPSARDDMHYDWMVQFFANRGYAVLQPNFRGSTGYGEAFEKLGKDQWGLAMQDDLTDGVKWLVSQGTVDARRVCIMGASYGGYAAMWGLIKDPDLYRCGISFAGVSDLPALFRYDNGFAFYTGWKQDIAGRDKQGENVSPINHVDAFKAPLLLVHGRKDRRVPPAQSEKLAAKMQKAGKAVTLVMQPEGDHFFSRQQDRIDFLKAMDDFLSQHNPAE